MIAARNLKHRYGTNEVLRLQQWNVAQGERWLVLGASGSGKTTLLHVIAGLIRPSEGEVEVSGENLRKLDGVRLDRWRGATVGIVLQALHLVRHLSVRDNLRLAQYMAHMPQDDTRVHDTLAALGVADKAARRPAELSQGMRQRLIAPLFQLSDAQFTLIVFGALAAVALSGLRSIPLAFVGGIALGIVQNLIAGYAFLASTTVDNHRFQAAGAINPQDTGSEGKLNPLLFEATFQDIRRFRVFARQEP